MIIHTVIPRLAWFWWQEKNRVRWNSCYASQNVSFYRGCPRGIGDILKRSYSSIFHAKESIQPYYFEFISIRKWLEKFFQKYLRSTIFYKHKIYKLVLGKFLFATSKIRAVQICAMENRGSRGMTVYTYMQIWAQFSKR